MAAGVPLAGTPVALEGIEAEDGRHCLIADTSTELAAAARSLLDDVEASRRMAGEARSLIAERYSWDTVGPEFSEVVRRAARAASVRS
jgi:glycosyltransferase involved in cell wall biosynthesis